MKKIIFSLFIMFGLSLSLQAKDKMVIDAEVKAALEQLYKVSPGSKELIKNKAKAVLVIPNIVKAGFGIGGEYGEGALLEVVSEDNQTTFKTVNYYSYASASIGFQFGVQKKTLIYAFMTEKSFENFKKSDGWKGGVGAGVAIANFGVSEDISNINVSKPVLLFVVGEQGLMYNLTLEGSKLTKIVR